MKTSADGCHEVGCLSEKHCYTAAVPSQRLQYAGQGAFGNANASASSTAVAQATAQAIATAVATASNSKHSKLYHSVVTCYAPTSPHVHNIY